MIEVDTITGPAAWAPYLINGDDSGLSEEERAAADRWRAGLDGFRVVSLADDPETGEPAEPWFTWRFELYGGAAAGGQVMDYICHRAE